LEHLHVKANFCRKKTVVKIGPTMAVFRKFKGLHSNCDHGDPKKAHPGRTDVFWRICRKNPFTVVGCSELQEPKKTLKTSPQMVRKITYMGRKTPGGSAKKNWYAEWRPQHRHARQFLSRLVKEF